MHQNQNDARNDCEHRTHLPCFIESYASTDTAISVTRGKAMQGPNKRQKQRSDPHIIHETFPLNLLRFALPSKTNPASVKLMMQRSGVLPLDFNNPSMYILQTS